MAETRVTGTQIKDQTVSKDDLDNALFDNLAEGVVKQLPWASGGQGRSFKVGNYVFIMCRNASTVFTKLSLIDWSYTTLNVPPANLETSGGIGWDGGTNLYTNKGGTSRSFYKYPIDGTWESLASSDVTKTGDAVGTGNGTTTIFNIFHGKAFPVSSDSIFASYTIYVNGIAQTETTHYTINTDTGVITFVTAPGNTLPITADYTLRCCMGSTGALPYYNGEFYCLLGDDTPVFIKYNVVGNSWSFLTDAPAGCDWASMAAEVRLEGGKHYLYALRGEDAADADTNGFWKYCIEDNAWTELTGCPATTDSGAVTIVDDWIIILIGKLSTSGYVYYIPSDKWTPLVPLPATTSKGSIVPLEIKDRGNTKIVSFLMVRGSGDEIYSETIKLQG